MPLETIYIARHGFRQSNAVEVAASATGTKRDPVLTMKGVHQAKELAEFFVTRKIELDMIFSSPYYRCLQTATPVAERLGKPIMVEFGISEFYQTVVLGTGLHPRPPLAAQLKKHFPLVAEDSHSPLLFVPQTGETIFEIHERARDFLRLFIRYLDEKHPDVRTVLLVSHAATIIALGRALSGNIQKDIRAGTCSLSQFVRNAGKKEQDELQGWDCVLNGSVDHLSGGEERHWDFSFIEEDMQEEGILEQVEPNEISQASPMPMKPKL